MNEYFFVRLGGVEAESQGENEIEAEDNKSGDEDASDSYSTTISLFIYYLP